MTARVLKLKLKRRDNRSNFLAVLTSAGEEAQLQAGDRDVSFVDAVSVDKSGVLDVRDQPTGFSALTF